jgi:transcription-repair coupling factor (superfamily II helicase)
MTGKSHSFEKAQNKVSQASSKYTRNEEYGVKMMFQQELLNSLAEDEKLDRLFSATGASSPFAVGLPPGFRAMAAARLFQNKNAAPRTVCLLTPDSDSAVLWRDNLKALLPDEKILIFPALELSPLTDFQPDAEVITERLAVLSALAKNEQIFVIAPADALLGRVESRKAFQEERLLLKPGVQISLEDLAKRLVELGYEREAMIDTPGTFACRGGIADIFPIGWQRPVRLDFFDIELESMRYFDSETQRSAEICEAELELYPCRSDNKSESFLDYLPKSAVLLFDEAALCEKSLREAEEERQLYFDDLLEAHRLSKADLQSFGQNFLAAQEVINGCNARPHTSFMELETRSELVQNLHIEIKTNVIPSYTGQMQLFTKDLAKWRSSGFRIFFCASSKLRAGRLRNILGDYDYPEAAIGVCALSQGFEYSEGKLVVITEKELLGQTAKSNRRRQKQNQDLNAFVELKPGDYVVHTNHGVGRFVGIERVTADGITADYLKIEYAAGDKLFIPVDQMDMVQKYIGSDSGAPKLNRLGGNQWEKTKAKVKASVQDMAEGLLQLYAAREKAQGFAFSEDTNWQREFEDAFEYEETQGQLDALADIKRDMQSSRPMDRLLCGDVGYGKTELAMRAAFKAVQDGKQVAMLAPTTLLAEQHFNNFCRRFEGYPVHIALLSRFVTAKRQKEVLSGLANGQIDILIGTHRLLSKDVQYASLGLLIVDEEQRFGVAHKEKIKQLRGSIDVLTLSATPIPRTLHMSLVGMRDMSVITTPPKDRLPVQTFVTEHHPRLLKNAIERELARGGQVYYIYNSVRDIEEKRAQLQELVPNARILAAHGKMTEHQLKPIMTAFLADEADILLCTTIAESGLDIPNVNTLIVENADNFGLAQLYQLRGRVGRSNRQAFAYFTYRADKQLQDDARKRLSAIRDFTQLGSGFKIAMRDLEIRGAGNLLGPEQHGHIAAVGFDLYCKLVNEAIEQGLGENQQPADKISDMKLDLGLNAYIPDDYIPETALKFEIYNKIAACRTSAESVLLKNELRDRFGEPPKATQNLFRLLTMRNLGQELGLISLIAPQQVLTLNFGAKNPFDGQTLLDLSKKYGKRLRFSGKTELLFRLNLQNRSEDERISEIEDFLRELVSLTKPQNEQSV